MKDLKDYEALSRKHFDGQAAEYDQRDTYYYSRIDNHILFKLAKSGDCHTTNRKGIEKMMRNVGFTVTDSRQIQGMIYTVTGKK